MEKNNIIGLDQYHVMMFKLMILSKKEKIFDIISKGLSKYTKNIFGLVAERMWLKYIDLPLCKRPCDSSILFQP